MDYPFNPTELKGVIIAAPLFIGWTLIGILSAAVVLIPLFLLFSIMVRELKKMSRKAKNCPEGGVPPGRA